MATASRARPYAIVTIADQSPPPETRSVTKNHAEAATTRTSRGKRKMRNATADATTIESSTTSSQKRNPPKAEPLLISGSQPNQSSSAPKKTTNAATALRAQSPAGTR